MELYQIDTKTDPENDGPQTDIELIPVALCSENYSIQNDMKQIPVDPNSENFHLKNNLAKVAHNIMEDHWFRVVLCGPSQSGKSTLINAVFGKVVAETGKDGTPTTMNLARYRDEKRRLEIIDTRGLERNVSNSHSLSQCCDSKPNIIWLVENYHSSIEVAEFKLIDHFPTVPVIVVLNKVDHLTESIHNFDSVETKLENHNCLSEKRKNLLQMKKEHRNIRRIVVTKLTSEGSAEFHPVGIDDLFEATISVLDAAAVIEFSRVVRVFNNKRLGGSLSIVFIFTASTTASAWIPIPILDAFVITSFQIAMVLALFGVWGVIGNRKKTIAISILKSVAMAGISCAAGVSLAVYGVGSLVKFIPGIGSVVGGILDSAIAGAATLIIGVAVTLWLHRVAANLSKMTEDELVRSFRDFVKEDKTMSILEKIKGKSIEDIKRIITESD